MPITVIRSPRAAELKLRATGRQSEDVSAVWREFSAYLHRQVYLQFRTNGAHFGTPWKPLTASHAARKAAAGHAGNPILVWSGRMRRSFSSPLNIERIGKRSAVFGSSNEKAVWHHYGTRRNGKQVNPPRPILVITPNMERYVARKLAGHMMEPWR